MRATILTYHALNIAGNGYSDNDHVAFATDLDRIHALGRRIVPLDWIVEERLGRSDRDLSDAVALTCDDGSDFDYFDIDHPAYGRQRSLFNALIDFRRRHGVDAQPDLHLTSFVIASPAAREVLDRRCLAGRDWMRDAWWRAALASRLMAIENHSWDHNHAELPETAQRDQVKGTFRSIDTHADADAEIRQASDWLDARCPSRATSLFAYPYGETNDYLTGEYFPHHASEHRLRAAFGTEPAPVDAGSDLWNLPRYVCGHHWSTPGELERILGETRSPS
ncbi:polysaccharide deacetylase family protein [Dokdonella sp.]|uniref:polysaccharide deacetylase family protein n=1 Tax=Dokdonella sp. TaxID=2291710 RepID=UPI00262637E0|nr:polysaccharide deacetylase family protein [Dokdonella sp.]